MKMMRKYLVLLCVLALAVSAMAISAAALETTRYEAEDAVYQASGMSSRDGAMTGFKDNPQAFVTFTVQSDKAGAQAVKILYSADGDCKLTVLTNGSKAGEVSLRAGENQTAELSATLAKGDNKITLWNEYGTIKA